MTDLSRWLSEKAREYCAEFAAEHEEPYRNEIPDSAAAEWMLSNIPLIECDDAQIERIYYFRFWTYRKHLKKTPEGWVVTEFLPQVGWSGKYNSIVCPVGHHIAEGRWLSDKTYVKDDIRSFLAPDRRDDRLSYSNTLIAGACDFCLAYRDVAFAKEIFPRLAEFYDDIVARHMTRYGLFWSHDDRDGMEYSVSGDGLRPTLNCYMYGAARGMENLCAMLGSDAGEKYKKDAEAWAERIQRYLWDADAGFFKTVPMDSVDGEADFARADADRNVMEEIGFLPWCYAGLADGNVTKDRAFVYLTDKAHFSAPFGITTADMAHPRFMKNTISHECLWDGPVWPFATSQTLTGIYTLLRRRDSTEINGETFLSLLKTYAASHVLRENGREIDWIDEDLDPFTGTWIARDAILHNPACVGSLRERGADYNHSTFCDLVLSGACGISLDGGVLRVKPLARGIWNRFAVTNLTFGGDRYDIYYDRDGNRYGFARGVTLCKNGEPVASGDGDLTYCVL